MSEQTLTEIRNDLTETQQALLDLLHQADDQNMLYQPPSDEDWTPAMVLAHISEARRFFAHQVEEVLAATPETKVGRTADDPHRVQAIENHGQDSAEDLRGQLITSHNKLIETLNEMTDDDLKLECEHITLGSFILGDFVQRIFVGHDRAHVQQVTDLLKGQR